MPIPDSIKTPLSAVFNAIKSPLSPKTQDTLERAPLVKGSNAFDEQSEKVEFRIEGMTCGACVEVRITHSPMAISVADEATWRWSRRLVNRRNAQKSTWHSLCQSRSTC